MTAASLLARLRADRFNLDEHPEPYAKGWADAMNHAAGLVEEYLGKQLAASEVPAPGRGVDGLLEMRPIDTRVKDALCIDWPACVCCKEAQP